MQLKWGLNFTDLHSLEGLHRLQKLFEHFVTEHGYTLPKSQGDNISAFLIDIAPVLDDFLAQLFSIEEKVFALRAEHKEFDIIYECKRRFVQRIAVKKYPIETLKDIDFAAVSKALQELLGGNITQGSFAKQVLAWQNSNAGYASQLDIAAQYAAYMVHNNSSLTIFSLPQSIDKDNLISSKKIEHYKSEVRYGFDYTADSYSEKALNNAHYCIYCHKQGKDSCSKGLVPATTDDKALNGCPLKQKISEMNLVEAQGFSLGALAIITLDNPMVAATGHRICNDCVSSCIYQKQDPVDVPLIESSILNNVLKLPYGLEIYLLLTRWNPLNIASPLPKKPTGYNALVVGLGPAGFSLAHYLLNEGHNVTAIDGLKISPLPFDSTKPIKYWSEYEEILSERQPRGFGGVTEYGITARWNKNNLAILRLILERRECYKAYGGIRFGSNITEEQAFELGFDHIAICIGAGEPKLPNFENFLAKGTKTASDFLMNLQSGGAFLKESINNLTIRMPVAVIGGGLTAIDTAIEAMNYYPVQVEKFLQHCEQSLSLQESWNEEDKLIAEEFIRHAKLFRAQKSPEQIREMMINQLGGVTIYYYKNLKNSAAYKLNPEEIMHAMAAGVKFSEDMQISKINLDDYGHCRDIEFKTLEGATHIQAKTVLFAIGTESASFKAKSTKNISYLGDCNPLYNGSVVKALASSKDNYHAITQNLLQSKPKYSGSYGSFISKLDSLLISTIKEVNILADNIVEVIVHSPLAASNFKPGQFFKLQNYSANIVDLVEPIALTGAYTDQEKGLISLIILEVGKSTKLCRKVLSPNQQIVLMGPTGEPTEILRDSNILLIGGGLGNAVLFSIGKALRQNNCKVTYIAGYKKIADRFYHEKLEEAADKVLWCCEEELLQHNRPEDISLKGNIIDGMQYFAQHHDEKIDRVIAIGSNLMMQAVKLSKDEILAGKLAKDCKLICSINSPMQCMMHGICGQCVQSVSGGKGYIFTCACQDQDASIVDFSNLSHRLAQNSLLEKI